MIEIRNLHKKFGDLEVLKGVDLTVAAGEVVCIIGPSGSGKSTLLRCINRLETPTSGTVVVDGHDIMDPRTDMVVVLTPPAVEPGEPPMNIKSIIKSIEGPVNCAILQELNPAVLAVTDWNTDARMVPLRPNPANEASFSRK